MIASTLVRSPNRVMLGFTLPTDSQARTWQYSTQLTARGDRTERPQHGYELMKELEARRGGFRRPSPGSVYPTLQMLEEGGYLTSEEVDGNVFIRLQRVADNS